jgi:hypothetical protein
VFVPGAVLNAFVVRPTDESDTLGPVAGDGPVLAAARLEQAPGDLRVGMDDPSLAERVVRSALNQHGPGLRRPWTWTVRVEDDPDADSAAPADASPPTRTSGAECDSAPDGVDRDPPAESGETGPEDASTTPASTEESCAGVPADARGPASLRETATGPDDEREPPSRDVGEAAGIAMPEDVLAGVVADPSTNDGRADLFASEETDGPTTDDTVGTEVERPRASRSVVVRLFVAAVWIAAGVAGGWYAAPWIAASAQPWIETFFPAAAVIVPRDPMFWTGPGAVLGLLLAWGCERWLGRST